MGDVLIDGTQVSYEHRCDRHGLGPRGIDLHDGEVLLLASKDVGSELIAVILVANVGLL